MKKTHPAKRLSGILLALILVISLLPFPGVQAAGDAEVHVIVAVDSYLYADGPYSVYQFAAPTGDGTALTGEDNPDNRPTDPNAPKQITVRVEDLYHGKTLIPETTVNVSGTHLDAIKAALAANGHDPDTGLYASYGYVSSILGVSAGSETGWMYALNGLVPSTALTETRVAEGDILILYFVNWYETVYFTQFDKPSATLTAGSTLTLTLTGSTTDMWTMTPSPYEPLAGAMVYAYDAAATEIGVSAVTDEYGKVTLTFPTVGTFTISARRAGGENETDLVPPICRVTVNLAHTPDPKPTITVSLSVTGDAVIVSATSVSILSGTTVFDLLRMVLDEHGIPYTYSGSGESAYIKSIAGLAEFDHGPNSGWTYSVTGLKPDVGAGAYALRKEGDAVVFTYVDDYTITPGDSRTYGGNSNTENESEGNQTPALTGDWINPYSDVSDTDWFYDAVSCVTNSELMEGVGNTQFSPHTVTTRAIMVAVLYRLEGKPIISGEISFTDVKSGEWYSDAILWAAQNDIVNGYGNGKFGLNDPVTREQAIVILYRYAKAKEMDVSVSADLSGYTDMDEISDWALDAMKWAVNAGIITGRTATTTVPQGVSTRAEIAMIIKQFCDVYKEGSGE